jgi:hypothetical protein
MALVSILLILVLWFVFLWLPVSILLAQPVELPTHAPARTVVSLSTFSQRVFQMRPTLDSIFEQSQFPDRVIITIPRKFRKLGPTTTVGWRDISVDPTHYNETEEVMVAWFSDYVDVPPVYRVHANVHKTSYVYDMGVLTVQFLDDDWGPGTKLVGALLLETHPDTVIVTLDDDVVYNRDTVRWLATHMKENIALAFGCETWNADGSNTFLSGTGLNFDPVLFVKVFLGPRVCDGWLMGWSGIAYHVSSFGPNIWTVAQSLSAECFNNDDIWLSAYMKLQGITKVLAPLVLHHINHARNLELSLSTMVNFREKEFVCARALFPLPQR